MGGARDVVAVWMAAACLGGCGSWPRWSADAAPVLSPGEADGAFTWGAPLEETEGENDVLEDAVAGMATVSSGETLLGVGELVGVGWCSAENGPPCQNLPPDPCDVPFGDPRGIYAGDVDTWVLAIEGEGPLTLCARAELEAGSGGGVAIFDLLLVPLLASGGADCPLEPVAGGGTDDDPLGYSIGPEPSGWAAPVDAGGRVAVLLAGALALEGDVGETFPYRVGFAVVPTAPEGGITHCPHLPNETVGASE